MNQIEATASKCAQHILRYHSVDCRFASPVATVRAYAERIGTGIGKSHLATALARHVILQGKRARFCGVVDLVNQLDAEKRAGAPGT